MSKNIKLNGETYNDITTIKAPLADDSGEYASFGLLEPIANDITASKVRSGYAGYNDSGVLVEGTIQDYLGSTEISANGTIPVGGKFCPSDLVVAIAGGNGCPVYQTEIEVTDNQFSRIDNIEHGLNSKKLIWFASLDFTKPYTPSAYLPTFIMGITPDAWLYDGDVTHMNGNTSNPRNTATTSQPQYLITDWGANDASVLRRHTINSIPDNTYQSVTYDSLTIGFGGTLTQGTWRFTFIDISGTNASY